MVYVLLLLSLAGIVYGADYLVAGSVAVARRYRISDFVIGAAIVGIGTSMPELTVSFLGAIQGNSEVAIGNVVGSNIFNILGILGLTALFFPISVTKANLKFEIPVCIAVSVLLTLLTFNFFKGGSATLSRPDGWLLLIVFAAFMWYSFYNDRKNPANDNVTNEAAPESPIWISILKIVGGLTLLILSCDIFIDNAVTVARQLGLSDAFISITLIACEGGRIEITSTTQGNIIVKVIANEGYTFAGWKESTGIAFNQSGSYTVSTSMTLKANFTKK